jgi:iron complex outermembrane receptor protein
VTVTRDVGRSPLDLPYSISIVRPDSLAPGQPHLLVEETLQGLPGVTVANRNNPTQDARISIRGFGARSAFGVRSIRVLRDGMPLTLPDGQTPIDYLDLESVGRVEAMRGTASALYGNASGGVLDLRTAPPPETPLAVQGRSWAGSSGQRRYTALFGGTYGAAAYGGNIGRTVTDGYRSYARQRLTNAFVRATTTVGATELGLVGLGLDMPVAENPGALTRIQFDTNPRMADPSSISKRARKEVHQVQIGLSARRALGASGEVVAQAYGGTRRLYNPLTFAVVGVDRKSSGASARATIPIAAGALQHRLSVGVDAQWLNDARKNWANCNAVPTANANCPGAGSIEQGKLSLDQRELVSSVGPYVRDELELGRLRASLGVRADNTTFEVRDAFLTDNRDDSGKRTMRAVSPMIAISARLTPLHAAYANVASAFETPTTTELGNHPDGSAGLNPDLKPQYSTTYETGIKGLVLTRLQYDVALFSTGVRDELIQFEVPGGNGRTYFRNAGRTRRRGAELALATDAGPLTLAVAYAWSHFRFVDFASGTSQLAGNAIPGIPEQQAQLTATWRIGQAFVVAEGIAKGKVYVNDANAAAAPGFGVANLRLGGTAIFGRPWLSPVVGVQNVLDKRYIGSIAVNAAGTVATAKFYEPAPGRTFFAGLSAATAPW